MLRVFRETERREWENFPRGRKYYFELDDDHKIFIDFLERSWTAQVLDIHDPDIHVFHQWRENSSYTREFALSLMSQEKRKFWLKFCIIYFQHCFVDYLLYLLILSVKSFLYLLHSMSVCCICIYTHHFHVCVLPVCRSIHYFVQQRQKRLPVVDTKCNYYYLHWL